MDSRFAAGLVLDHPLYQAQVVVFDPVGDDGAGHLQLEVTLIEMFGFGRPEPGAEALRSDLPLDTQKAMSPQFLGILAHMGLFWEALCVAGLESQ
jgi:hypothetical protein